MTDQELKDLVASLAIDRKETDLIMQETGRKMQETDRLIKELREEQKETARQIKELGIQIDGVKNIISYNAEQSREEQKETARRMQETDLIMQETGRKMQETDRLIKELREEQKETDRMMQENSRLIKELREEQKETARQIKELGIQIGGINDNIGYHAEQFFQDVFKRKLEFGRVKYDEMIPNLIHKDKGIKIEFDIVLLNGSSIALIEVKNRIHPSFVKELAEERIEKFRKYFPRYNDYSAYLGIAGFSFSDEVLGQASKYGVGIAKQVGEGVEIEANNLRAY
jgi:hypothetical protein